jgi:hypothetical protein
LPICIANGGVEPTRQIFTIRRRRITRAPVILLGRATEVFATAERRRFALQIAENFARNPPFLKTFFFFQKPLDKIHLPCYNGKAF